MNRPKLENYLDLTSYYSALEKYYDELEHKLSKGDCISHYEKEIERLNNALDKIISLLPNGYYLKDNRLMSHYTSKEEWKDWCMNDDQTIYS